MQASYALARFNFHLYATDRCHVRPNAPRHTRQHRPSSGPTGAQEARARCPRQTGPERMARPDNYSRDTSARHVLSTRTLSRLAQVTGRRLDPSPPQREVSEVLPAPPAQGPSDVPIMGHARGGQDGIFSITAWWIPMYPGCTHSQVFARPTRSI